jgi:hypothetical protein
MKQQELSREQQKFATNLDVLFTAMARSLKLNGVPIEVINKAFFAGNAAVQMISQNKNPSEEGLTG